MITSYLFLVLAVVLGTASNSFAKSAEGFTLWIPSIITAITIVLCMYSLSQVMKVIPVGVTYASFAGLTIIATATVGVFKFNQMPNLYTLTSYQNKGMGSELLKYLLKKNQNSRLLVGTWRNAVWAIRFYEKFGFILHAKEQSALLLKKYWRIPSKQIKNSVVLERL